MRSTYTGHVSSAEWRWVFAIGSILVGLAAFPLLWMLISDVAGTKWAIMGALHNHQDGAAELSRVFQGKDGAWMTRFLHTPEPQDGTLIGVFYALLGQVARFTQLAPVVVFHIARGGVALFMYVALYQLPANIWMKQRPRQVFFILVTIGSGFGWILAPLTNDIGFLDLTTPGAFPFYSTLVNVHYPIAIACLALITSVIVVIFRPGQVEAPNVYNGGLLVFVLSLILAFVYPLALIPITIAFATCLGIDWYKTREITRPRLNWFMWYCIPALPMLAYYVSVLRYNDVASEMWVLQNTVESPSIPLFLLGLGLPLIIALPGIYRAVRRFEPDGDRFMLIWLVVMVLCIYLPTGFHQQSVVGIMLPIVYFATRATEDFWLRRVTSRRWQRRIFAAAIPFIAATNILVLILPLRALSDEERLDDRHILLQQDYADAFDWFNDNMAADAIILASPDVSLWIPAKTGAKVFYSHDQQTLQPATKERALLNWYRETDANRCQPLLLGELSFSGPYTVSYILVGPKEQAIGESICLHTLDLVESFGEVQIYAYVPPEDPESPPGDA